MNTHHVYSHKQAFSSPSLDETSLIVITTPRHGQNPTNTRILSTKTQKNNNTKHQHNKCVRRNTRTKCSKSPAKPPKFIFKTTHTPTIKKHIKIKPKKTSIACISFPTGQLSSMRSACFLALISSPFLRESVCKGFFLGAGKCYTSNGLYLVGIPSRIGMNWLMFHCKLHVDYIFQSLFCFNIVQMKTT